MTINRYVRRVLVSASPLSYIDHNRGGLSEILLFLLSQARTQRQLHLAREDWLSYLLCARKYCLVQALRRELIVLLVSSAWFPEALQSQALTLL